MTLKSIASGQELPLTEIAYRLIYRLILPLNLRPPSQTTFIRWSLVLFYLCISYLFLYLISTYLFVHLFLNFQACTYVMRFCKFFQM